MATVVALCALILVAAHLPPATEARAAPEPVGDGLVGSYDPYPARSLDLTAPGELKVGARGSIQVEGNAFAGDELSVFVDPGTDECPAAASEPKGAISLVSESVDEGDFRFEETYRPQGAGDRLVCGYLGPTLDAPALREREELSVTARRLRKRVAERTVITALERHGFARRVVKSVHIDCARRSRNAFACKFADRLAGYRLRARGKVKLGVELSYAFRVTAQGVRFTLTDENEERRPG